MIGLVSRRLAAPLLGILLALLAIQGADAYRLIRGGGIPDANEGVTVSYYTAGEPYDAETDIIAAANAWNGISDNFHYVYVGKNKVARVTVSWDQSDRYRGLAAGTRTYISSYWGMSPAEVRQVATHELGHALGLNHSDTTDAVMWYSMAAAAMSVTEDDRAGLRAIYDATPTPTATKTVTRTPSPTKTPTKVATATPTVTPTATATATPQPQSHVGWALLTGLSGPVAEAVGECGTVYWWNAAEQDWQLWARGVPAYVNSLSVLAPTEAYWVYCPGA
mgnify:CR=1 FL=1